MLKFLISIFIILLLVYLVILKYKLPTSFSLPPALGINLESNRERRQMLMAEFKDWHIERFNAIKRTPGTEGCALSHISCIELAKNRKYPWVLIIEDDCILNPNARTNFLKLLPFLWENRTEWDFFSGGTTFIREHRWIDKKLKVCQVKGFASQFMLIHYEAYSKVIDLFYKQEKIPLIDVFYKDNFRIWTSVPYISGQRPTKSDISGKEENYAELFTEAEQLLMNDL